MNICDAEHFTRSKNGRSWYVPTTLGRILVSLTGKPNQVKLTIEENGRRYSAIIAKKTFFDALRKSSCGLVLTEEAANKLIGIAFTNADRSEVFFLNEVSVPTMMVVAGSANSVHRWGAKAPHAHDAASVALAGGSTQAVILTMIAEALDHAVPREEAPAGLVFAA